MSDSIQRIKLCEDVANHITERIRTQVWAVGRKLPPETELAALFDVSRATIRSAVKSLQLSGILYSRSGSGTYVSESAPLVLETRELADVMADPQNLYALVQARYILEPQLSALAAKNATEEEISQLFSLSQDPDDICSGALGKLSAVCLAHRGGCEEPSGALISAGMRGWRAEDGGSGPVLRVRWLPGHSCSWFAFLSSGF